MKQFQQISFFLFWCAIMWASPMQAQIQIGADIDGEAAGDQSGYSVSMPDVNTLAIGAPFNGGIGSDAGHVRVYSWNGGTWVQKGADIEGAAAGDQSGSSVSMPDANTVAIGARFNSGSGFFFSGHVRVYSWNGSAWVQQGADIYGELGFDESGFSVSMPDANTVAIGAPFNDGNGSASGHVRIYSWNGSAWSQQGADIDGEVAGDQSGYSVSMPDANTVAIGARFNEGNGHNAGHVRVYSWNGSSWIQQGADIDGEAVGDQSGHSVNMPDANTVAIGAPFNDGNGSAAGHVRVYSWNGSVWVQQGADIDGEAAFDESGWSVSMPDANTVAIGAPFNSGNGSLRVYSWNGSAWVQKGANIYGEAAGDESGYSVSMPDANTVAIGAARNDGNGVDAGHVRVYSICTSASCDDGDPCTDDICDPVLGCLNNPLPDSDGDGICDAEDNCPALFGEIGDPCDDGIPCTENDMIDASCECHGTPNNTLCDDGLFCNGVETCDPLFGCVAGNPVVCDDGINCTIDACDEGIDSCIHTPNDGVCDDGDPCTVNTCSPVDGCVHTNICGPVNDNCSGAVNIPLLTFPDAWSEIGTLSDATSTGPSNCDPQSDPFYDVFYEFSLSAPNKVYVDVFSYAPVGFTPVVEVYDGCGGTVEACGASTGISVITIVTPELPAGTYKIRVGGHSPVPLSGLDGEFLLSVRQLPLASVQNNPGNPLYSCNQSGFQLEDFVGADPQSSLGTLDYEWLVAEVGGGTFTEWQRGEPNYVTRCEWLGMDYGKTYNVFVRLLVDLPFYEPEWGVYQGDHQNPNLPGASACTITTASNVTPTEMRPNYSPTNASGNHYALCDFAIAYNVSGSENFRWRFDGNGTPGDAEDIIYTRGSGNPSVRLSWVNGLVPGITYNVAVEVQVSGLWSGYSTALPLTLALPPNDVEIRSPFCGGTYAPSGYIMSQSVCEADLYQFRFTPTGGGAPSYRNSGNYVCFMSAANPALTPGDYDVQVKVTQSGVPGDWGPACTITIAGPQGQTNETPALRDTQLVGNATLFPNPNSGSEVRVQLDGLSDGNHVVNIMIYDIYGKMISSEGFGHEGNSLSRLVHFDGNLNMGMYMVQIVVDGERFATERLVVK